MDRKLMRNRESNAFLLELSLIPADSHSPLQVFHTPSSIIQKWIYINLFCNWFLAGSLCEWKHKTIDKWAESETFEDYKETLILECESGREQPANLTWTVPLDAPKTLYYQVIFIYFSFKLIVLLIYAFGIC